MDAEQYKTPQKSFPKHSSALKFLGASTSLVASHTKFAQCETPSSVSKKSTSAFHVFPFMNTPPSRFPKVMNPFEPALTERLHLPLIGSPSLFQRPATPQHCSTQFEWTIDELSSLGPANVEPHETQFQATSDPELEAKAQAAINSYFKQQQIVPSPDYSGKNQQIAVPNLVENTPEVKPVRRIRDGIAQTILTFPINLSHDLEKILEQFFTFKENQQQSPTIDCDTTIDYEARDASLRRKLFETSAHSEHLEEGEMIEILVKAQEFSPPPKSPDLDVEVMTSRASGGSLNKSSFGSLSPISKFNISIQHSKDDEDEYLESPKKYIGSSPISSTNYNLRAASPECPDNLKTISIPRSSSNQSLYRSTPEIIQRNHSPVNMSVDASYIEYSKRHFSFNKINKSKSFSEVDMLHNSLNNFEEDEMQVSQLSAKSTSSSQSSQHPDTPIRKRSASRKNLSHSFTYHCSDDENEDADEIIVPPLQIRKFETIGLVSGSVDVEKSTFHRTDSGFNEMTNTQDDTKFSEFKMRIAEKENINPILDVSMNEDISMICCSTPSKKYL